MGSRISFKPLDSSLLQQLYCWQGNTHVKKYWGDRPDYESFCEKYESRIDSSVSFSYIALIDDIPFGHIQYYWASKVGHGWWENYSDKTVGIDFFIGEKAYLSQGLGQEMITEFLKQVLCKLDIDTIISDPSPENIRSLYCLSEVGFADQGIIETPDGSSVLMKVDALNGQLVFASPARIEHKVILNQMLQVYLLELSEFQDISQTSGVFDYPYFDLYWEESERFPYILYVNGAIAGFAFVRDEKEYFSMAEFYLKPEFRGSNIGFSLACNIIKRFDGFWVIEHTSNNSRAKGLWTRVVGSIAEKHEEKHKDDWTIYQFELES